MACVSGRQQISETEAVAELVADDIHDAGACAGRSGNRNLCVTGHIDAKLNWPNLTPDFPAAIVNSVNVHVRLAGEEVSHILRAQSDTARNRAGCARRS